MVSHAVDYRAHTVLTHTEVHIPSCRFIRLEGFAILQPGIIRGRQVGRTTHELGKLGSKLISIFLHWFLRVAAPLASGS